MYIKLLDGIAVPYSIGQLKIDHKDISFPDKISDDMLASFDVFYCEEVLQPEVDHTKNVTSGNAEIVDGVWKQTWIVNDATQEEISTRVDHQWTLIRNQRNKNLFNSDWTQLPDAKLTDQNRSEWAAYRQALRDITLQDDPFNIAWPEQP